MNEKDWTNLTDSDLSSDDNLEDQEYQNPTSEGYSHSHSRSNRDYRDSHQEDSRHGYRGYRSNRGGRFNHSRRGGGYNRRNKIESQPKEVILDFMNGGGENNEFWLNIFNLDDDVSEGEIMEFYSKVPALEVESHRGSRLTMDVLFGSIEDVEKAIDLGVKEINGVPFMIRSSMVFYF